MIGLRYHLKIRTVIFRRRKLIKSKVKRKTVLKDKVKLPNGLQTVVEAQARHEADWAGDLQFINNPYAVGGQKCGYNLSTGRQEMVPTSKPVVKKRQEGNSSAPHRGKGGGSFKRPYVRNNNYTYARYNNATGETHGG